jgi:hypothetical protein
MLRTVVIGITMCRIAVRPSRQMRKESPSAFTSKYMCSLTEMPSTVKPSGILANSAAFRSFKHSISGIANPRWVDSLRLQGCRIRCTPCRLRSKGRLCRRMACTAPTPDTPAWAGQGQRRRRRCSWLDPSFRENREPEHGESFPIRRSSTYTCQAWTVGIPSRFPCLDRELIRHGVFHPRFVLRRFHQSRLVRGLLSVGPARCGLLYLLLRRRLEHVALLDMLA